MANRFLGTFSFVLICSSSSSLSHAENEVSRSEAGLPRICQISPLLRSSRLFSPLAGSPCPSVYAVLNLRVFISSPIVPRASDVALRSFVHGMFSLTATFVLNMSSQAAPMRRCVGVEGSWACQQQLRASRSYKRYLISAGDRLQRRVCLNCTAAAAAAAERAHFLHQIKDLGASASAPAGTKEEQWL